ncbi:hypothetical protein DFH06DRAFT_1345553 [Mycena polygramma]|nr:hypothetical protein DFH06DRAFT_1345553 [Mycena polygramma]
MHTARYRDATKLSSPPRIIACVRLETRSAAEEIIERLHGRMVRGWNDPGSRISVRFADTSEQRELRRSVRLTREGDQASNQLSIAQATLLNLRGKELHARPPIGPSTHLDNFHADTYEHFAGDAYSAADFEVDYSRQQQQQQTVFTQFGVGAHQQLPAQQRMNPAMASLLDSLQASSAAFRVRDPYAQRLPRAPAAAARVALQHARVRQHAALRPTRARHHAHADADASAQRKRRHVPLDLNHTQRHHEMDSVGANIGMGVRGYRAQASTLSFPHHQHQQHLPSLRGPSQNHDFLRAQPPAAPHHRSDACGAHTCRCRRRNGSARHSESAGLREENHSVCSIHLLASPCSPS